MKLIDSIGIKSIQDKIGRGLQVFINPNFQSIVLLGEDQGEVELVSKGVQEYRKRR